MKTLPSITRRTAMLIAAGSLVSGRALAAPSASPIVEEIDVNGIRVKLTRYEAPGSEKRPVALLLHGSRGLDGHMGAYERYARDLADANIDAWIFSYFGPDDRQAIAEAGGEAGRMVQYGRLIDQWVKLVRGVGQSARGHDRSSGHVGLVGFSLGGFVAVAAASEPRFSVLTLFYAGLPSFYRHEIKSLPPVIDIHGDRDHAVSLHEGEHLIATAKRLGGVAELAVFSGEGHGFGLDPASHNAALARQRATAFTTQWINQG